MNRLKHIGATTVIGLGLLLCGGIIAVSLSFLAVAITIVVTDLVGVSGYLAVPVILIVSFLVGWYVDRWID